MNILKSSVFVRLVILIARAYRRSAFAAVLKRIGIICKNSLIYRFIRKYFRKRCLLEYSFVFRCAERLERVVNRFMRAVGKRLNRIFRGSIFVRSIRSFSKYGFGVMAVVIAFLGVVIGALLCVLLGGSLPADIVIVVGAIAFVAACGAVLHDYTRGLYILSAYAVVDWLLRTCAPGLAGMWDEAFFLGLVCLCLWKWAVFNRDRRGVVYSPMDIPIIAFMAVMVFVFFVNSPDPKISLEGLRVVIQYVLWYFVVIRLVKDGDKAVSVSKFFAVVVGIMALHGIFQFVIGVEMPAGWVDQNEAGVRTRVFSILTSPNIFGSLLTLAAPISLGIAFGEDNTKGRLFYGCIALAMLASLVFTFSRGAWMGLAAAFAVYVLIKDKRLLLPGIIAALLVVLLVPSVGNRITYMLSSEYIESSLRGGRLIRWIMGLQVLDMFPVFGVGLGHFGGAVAMNHSLQTMIGNKYEDTFYMDNNYLKIAVETGIVGLVAMIMLMYCVIINSLRTVAKINDKRLKELTTGITAGLTGIIVHNCVENVFEVPLMCTVFWLFVGVIMAVWYHDRKDRIRSVKIQKQ